jgi:hypothetical protein
MKLFALVVLTTILLGCRSEEKKSEPPLRENFEAYWMRMHSVPEFIQAEEMRLAGHVHMRNAYRALKIDDIIQECDSALECYSAAADLYFAGKKKYPEFSEYVNSELDLTYKFIEESVRERPSLTKPTEGAMPQAEGPSDEQKARMKILQEKIRQYEAAQIK